ncbi:deaminase domain-containing protein [Lysinibacillus sp. FJAT-14745]
MLEVVCDSCDQVVQQFNKKYPNIKIEVIHNSDNSISPKYSRRFLNGL